MRRRASALFLPGGWLLLLPPSETKVVDGLPSVKVDKEAPISRWLQESAYDTASECQAGIRSLATVPMPEAEIEVFAAARCVRSEVVYPRAHK